MAKLVGGVVKQMEGATVEEAVAKSPSPEPSSDTSKEEATGASLEEPFAGNVSQRIPMPPDGEPGKKGLLQFDACFEGGEVVNSNHYYYLDIDAFFRESR